MGGKGAKERRRLARLATNGEGGGGGGGEQQSSSSSTHKETATWTSNRQRVDKGHQKKEEIQFSRQPQLFGRRRVSDGRHAPNPRFAQKRAHDNRQRQQPRTNVKAESKKKKPKLKKPKHLKRKIEMLSEEDEGERQDLVNELHQFEARKSSMAKPVTKRQKPSVPNTSETRGDVSDKTLVKKNELKVDETPRQVAADDNKKHATADPAVETDVASLRDTSRPTVATEDDSDSDISLEDATMRKRGRRRRGRKSVDEQSMLRHEDTLPEKSDATSDESSKTEAPTNNVAGVEKTSDSSKKTPKKDDKRRCIGRKPVTDFVVGQRYSGKVVYTKQFGAFIDIGCHSDAFCHVSRLRDDYVESLNDVLSIGQEVSARVVEVDRKAKRITVSLQSDARIEDERASVEARRERKEKPKKGKRTSEATCLVENATLAPPTPPSKHHAVSAPSPSDESMMTPAECKRARKLARRVARREQQAQTGLSV